LLSQRLFWGRPLGGAKSKELGPMALKQLLIFYAPLQPASISQNTRMSFAKNFQSIPSEFLQLFLGHLTRFYEGNVFSERCDGFS
jgi:hypothetical protein